MTDGWGAQGHNHMTVIHQTGRVSVPLLLAVVILTDILVTEFYRKEMTKNSGGFQRCLKHVSMYE